MLSCREVIELADRLFERRLSWRERMAVRLHLTMCRHCGRYERQLQLLLEGLEKQHRPASEAEVRRIMELAEQHRASNHHEP